MTILDLVGYGSNITPLTINSITKNSTTKTGHCKIKLGKFKKKLKKLKYLF